MMYFILDAEHRPIRTTDVLYWAAWFEDFDNRRVAVTETECWKISTVFLALDHQFGKGPPLLFETMAFPKEGQMLEECCERYSSWDDAEAGHAAMVRRLQKLEAETKAEIGKKSNHDAG